ncbi:MAG TPA: hypothetical protein V6D48_09485 [Oculatellaceae cyanobacterium]
MSYFSDSKVIKAGTAGQAGRLYVWLRDSQGKHDAYFQLDSSQGKENQLLATALTAISLDAPVDADVGGDGDPKDDWDCYYCYTLYVRRE